MVKIIEVILKNIQECQEWSKVICIAQTMWYLVFSINILLLQVKISYKWRKQELKVNFV